MALKDGIVRCNGNLGGLAHCCLPPAALLLLQHPFAMILLLLIVLARASKTLWL